MIQFYFLIPRKALAILFRVADVFPKFVQAAASILTLLLFLEAARLASLGAREGDGRAIRICFAVVDEGLQELLLSASPHEYRPAILRSETDAGYFDVFKWFHVVAHKDA